MTSFFIEVVSLLLELRKFYWNLDFIISTASFMSLLRFFMTNHLKITIELLRANFSMRS